MFRLFFALVAGSLSLAPLLVPAATAKPAETPGKTVSVPAEKQFVLPPSAPSKAQPYALNVVYFVPADMEPFPDYERRLSEILLSYQQFYGEEMARNGYPGCTFGLNKSKDGKTVTIITVKGKKNGADYPYSGSAGKILSEVNAFFAQKDSPKKLSDHSLIILPSTTGDAMSPGGVPFYGFGKDCYALDYPLFDIKYRGQKSKVGNLFTKWYGGMAHELGHGLNLPHNSGTRSDEKAHGTALMGYGNYTLGKEPTFLTPASAAILSQCQVFRTTKMPRTPAPHFKNLPEVAIRFGTGGLRVSGKLPPKHRIAYVTVFFDKDECNDVNADYDAESFVAPVDEKTQTFTLEIPFSEIHPGRTEKFQVRLRLINDDGSCSIIRYNFDSKEKDLLLPENTKLAELEPPSAPPPPAKNKPDARANKKKK